MNYIGDFPPCTHKFVNSNGIVLCELCGAYSSANRQTAPRDTPMYRLTSEKRP